MGTLAGHGLDGTCHGHDPGLTRDEVAGHPQRPGAVRPLVVPVPLRRASRRRRGYNQAAGLARGLAARLRLTADPAALRRRREGEAQAGRTRRQRRRQARAALAACPWRVHGRHVLLVDDVISTGATADAAARALRLAGATHVDVLTLAT